MAQALKFLNPYTKEDRSYFFGRDGDIENLYKKIRDYQILLFYGLSGTGKTSLILCGLLKKFDELDIMPLVVRRGTDFNVEILASIKKQLLILLNKEDGESTVYSLLENLYYSNYQTIYLVVDQFEELFIYSRKEDKEIKEFIDFLTRAQKDCPFLKVILVVREEFLGILDKNEFYDKIPQLFQSRIQLNVITDEKIIEIIKSLGRAIKFDFDDDVAHEIAERIKSKSTPDLGEARYMKEGKIQLTNLQVFLYALREKCKQGAETRPVNDGFISITLDDLPYYGRVNDVLKDFLDDYVEKIAEKIGGEYHLSSSEHQQKIDEGLSGNNPDADQTNDNKKLIWHVLKTMVSYSGTKQKKELRQIVDEISDENFKKKYKGKIINRILEEFVSMQIVQKQGNDAYEIRHDALAAKVYDKKNTDDNNNWEATKLVWKAFESGFSLSKDQLVKIEPFRSSFVCEEADRIKLNKYIDEQWGNIRKGRIKTKLTRFFIASCLFLFAAAIFFFLFANEFNNKFIALSVKNISKNAIEHINEKNFTGANGELLQIDSLLNSKLLNILRNNEIDSQLSQAINKLNSTLLFHMTGEDITLDTNFILFGYLDSINIKSIKNARLSLKIKTMDQTYGITGNNMFWVANKLDSQSSKVAIDLYTIKSIPQKNRPDSFFVSSIFKDIVESGPVAGDFDKCGIFYYLKDAKIYSFDPNAGNAPPKLFAIDNEISDSIRKSANAVSLQFLPNKNDPDDPSDYLSLKLNTIGVKYIFNTRSGTLVNFNSRSRNQRKTIPVNMPEYVSMDYYYWTEPVNYASGPTNNAYSPAQNYRLKYWQPGMKGPKSVTITETKLGVLPRFIEDSVLLTNASKPRKKQSPDSLKLIIRPVDSLNDLVVKVRGKDSSSIKLDQKKYLLMDFEALNDLYVYVYKGKDTVANKTSAPGNNYNPLEDEFICFSDYSGKKSRTFKVPGWYFNRFYKHKYVLFDKENRRTSHNNQALLEIKSFMLDKDCREKWFNDITLTNLRLRLN